MRDAFAYYNEIDPYAAQWLRRLMRKGHIAPGYVDERSIEDVRPGDLDGFTQCHFFSGIGVWSLALRRAGWRDDRPVWTGSCPCQPFSTAGKGAGFDDQRHLWPAFHHLIEKRRPAVVLGEQVASKDADRWIDLVCADLEALGYAFGAVPFPSAGIGAPHIRDRVYWVGHAAGARPQRRGHGRGARSWRQGGAAQRAGAPGGVADAQQHGGGRQTAPAGSWEPQADGSADQHGGHSRASAARPGPANGLWRDADWLLCRDGRWRPVEPGTFPLAHGAPARVGRLRAYGNAINAEAARAFVECVMQIRENP